MKNDQNLTQRSRSKGERLSDRCLTLAESTASQRSPTSHAKKEMGSHRTKTKLNTGTGIERMVLKRKVYGCVYGVGLGLEVEWQWMMAQRIFRYDF